MYFDRNSLSLKLQITIETIIAENVFCNNWRLGLNAENINAENCKLQERNNAEKLKKALTYPNLTTFGAPKVP